MDQTTATLPGLCFQGRGRGPAMCHVAWHMSSVPSPCAHGVGVGAAAVAGRRCCRPGCWRPWVRGNLARGPTAFLRLATWRRRLVLSPREGRQTAGGRKPAPGTGKELEMDFYVVLRRDAGETEWSADVIAFPDAPTARVAAERLAETGWAEAAAETVVAGPWA